MRYARAPIPPDDDDEAWTERIAAASGGDNLRNIERLHDRLVSNRGKLVRSLANKFDPATLASLATITLALISTEKVLREGGSSAVWGHAIEGVLDSR
jgi:hypothetical protein